jgi:hypothetical protein
MSVDGSCDFADLYEPPDPGWDFYDDEGIGAASRRVLTSLFERHLLDMTCDVCHGLLLQTNLTSVLADKSTESTDTVDTSGPLPSTCQTKNSVKQATQDNLDVAGSVESVDLDLGLSHPHRHRCSTEDTAR